MLEKTEFFSKILLFLFTFSLISYKALFLSPKIVWTTENLHNARDTLSDSRPEITTVKHTIYFKNTTALGINYKIIIDFSSQFNLTTSHTYADMSMRYSANADMSSSTTCTLAAVKGAGEVGVSVDTDLEKITFTLADSGNCSSDITANKYIEIVIGDGAAGGSDDITNPTKSAAPGTADTYLISYETQNASSTSLDTATVRVAIIDAVTITAEVQATLSCTISGVASGTNFNTSPGGNTYGTAGVGSTTTTIPFGILNSSAATQAGQLLKVSTNSTNGFYIGVKQSQDLTSAGSDTINAFDDGATVPNSDPTTWSAPAGTAGSADTYGHMGYGTTDLTLEDTIGLGAQDRFTGAKFAGLTSSYSAVLSHSGPADGTGSDTNGQGYVVYKIQISGLQETGVYSNTVSYLCTARY